MTDQEIDEIATPFSSFCVASGSREFDHLGFARALFSKSAQSIMNNAAIDDIAAEVFGTMATHQERQFAHRILSRAIPEGHVVVPKEPTPEMEAEGFKNITGLPHEVWTAMIAAAPANKEG